VTRTVLAYLDPGSSSMIIQILLGGVAAVGVTLKLYWRRFKRFLHIGGKQEDVPETRGPARTNATANGSGGNAANGAVEREPVETQNS